MSFLRLQQNGGNKVRGKLSIMQQEVFCLLLECFSLFRLFSKHKYNTHLIFFDRLMGTDYPQSMKYNASPKMWPQFWSHLGKSCQRQISDADVGHSNPAQHTMLSSRAPHAAAVWSCGHILQYIYSLQQNYFRSVRDQYLIPLCSIQPILNTLGRSEYRAMA